MKLLIIIVTTLMMVSTDLTGLNAQEAVKEPESIDWQTFCEARGDAHPEKCPLCGRRLVRLADIPRVSILPVEEAIPHAA